MLTLLQFFREIYYKNVSIDFNAKSETRNELIFSAYHDVDFNLVLE